MKTKVLSCFIIFAMLLSTFLLEFPAIAADTADTAAWDGSVAASFSGGSGTADDPWKISNGSELAYLASLVNSNGSATYNQYYILTADIDLGGREWTGIGNQNNAAKAFKGKFDGNGKVITGFAINEERDYRPGLFGKLDAGAVVKNLTVHGRVRAGSKKDNFSGLLCASVEGSSAVENCTVYADVQITREAGSIDFYFGGITGRLAPGGKIQDCTAHGKIQLQVTTSATNKERQYTAGIAARIDAAQITNCTNYADISQIFTGSATIAYSSGIAAVGDAANDTTVSISNCVNYGDIFVETNGGHGRTGGIIGNARSKAVYNIENCFNAGKMLSGKGTQSGNMGELVGLNEAKQVSLKNCYASGSNLAGNKGKTWSESGCVTGITLKTLPGASVRLNDPTGLRFDTEIKKSTLDTLLKADNVTVKIGTLIAPTKYVKAVGTFTADALDTYKNEQGFAFDPYINVPFDTNVYKFLEETDTAYTFSGAVANLFESNYNLAYSAVGYLTITVGDLSVTFYSDYIEQDHSRTIASVAREAYNDRADAQSENYPYYVEQDGNYSPYSNSSLAKIKAFADAYKE